jgi:hypothetical protein
VSAPADLALQRVEALAESARKEYRHRQIGLAVSIALTGLVMLVIFLRLRRFERQGVSAP